MLSSNTNKMTWVGVTVGVVAALGVGAMALYPNAMSTTKTAMVKAVSKFSGSDSGENTSGITVNNHQTANMTMNVAYSKLPNGKYITGKYGSAMIDNVRYIVPRNDDVDYNTFYKSQQDTTNGFYNTAYDGNKFKSLTLSNGLKFVSPNGVYLNNNSASSAQGQAYLNSGLSTGGSMAGTNYLNGTDGKIEKSTSTSGVMTFGMQEIMSLTNNAYTFDSVPVDFDISLINLHC